MQKEEVKRRKKLLDFPEHQVGYPERNDASNPNYDMERIHVDLETLGLSKKSAAEIAREMRESQMSQSS